MARALQCPACGTTKQLDGVTADTFRCEECGQVLKVPTAARAGAGGGEPAAPPPRRRPSPAAPTSDAPAPPRRNPTPPEPVIATPPTVTASRAAAPPRGRPPAGSGGEPAPPTRKPPRNTLPLWMRIGVWVLAVPIGLVIVGVPARSLGYLTSQKLLDVFVKHSLSRFVPLLVIVVLWALATTILVEVFVEGGRWLMLRRQRRHATADLQSLEAPPRQRPGRSRRRGA